MERAVDRSSVKSTRVLWLAPGTDYAALKTGFASKSALEDATTSNSGAENTALSSRPADQQDIHERVAATGSI